MLAARIKRPPFAVSLSGAALSKTFEHSDRLVPDFANARAFALSSYGPRAYGFSSPHNVTKSSNATALVTKAQ